MYRMNIYHVVLIFVCMATWLIFDRQHNAIHDKTVTKTEVKVCEAEYRNIVPSNYVLLFQEGTNNITTEKHLLQYISNHILGPSHDPRIKKTNQTDVSQIGQSTYVDKLLHQRTNGFFVECGGADGIAFSNSLYFERMRNWTGLLVEANPFLFQNMLQNNRKSYQLNACLSPTLEPQMLHFKPAKLLGGLSNFIGDAHIKKVEERLDNRENMSVQCFSLYHIMKALGRDHIDYFSLDVEGAELNILKSIPWEKLRIDVLTVEYNQLKKDLNKLKNYMETTGLYRYEGVILPPKHRHAKDVEAKGQDAVFVRRDLFV